MKKLKLLLAFAVTLGAWSTAQAQGVTTPRVVTCDTAAVQQSPFTVQDEASHKGAVVENPTLITLSNGMKAVQFSVRHARRSPDFHPNIIKVRYTVDWTDLCGRHIKVGSPGVQGLVLNPQRQEIVQSTAMHRDAAHAALRIYVVD
ncbi:hypothetical protein VRY85_01785 [Achromobacter sp. F4_2707]|uniref:hypothetical protein n=1 Tax=Achromobacter sp. F4_2707 TaxID=3114286 RepID=UPI0039C6EE0D